MIGIKSLLHDVCMIGSTLKFNTSSNFSAFSFSLILIFTIPTQKWVAKLVGH